MCLKRSRRPWLRCTASTCSPEIRLSEAPAPSRLAPHAHALTAEIGADQSVGTGRCVLLHDPVHRPRGKPTRLVVYVETDIDSEMAEDRLLTDVGWAWLQECLAAAEVPYAALGGTVTAVRSTSFEALSARGRETSIQIRASWSALGLRPSMDHFSVWIALMEMCAGLPVLSGIARIGEIS